MTDYNEENQWRKEEESSREAFEPENDTPGKVMTNKQKMSAGSRPARIIGRMPPTGSPRVAGTSLKTDTADRAVGAGRAKVPILPGITAASKIIKAGGAIKMASGMGSLPSSPINGILTRCTHPQEAKIPPASKTLTP